MEQYLSVSDLTRYISQKFQRDPYLEKVYLKGEISNYNAKRKGITQYFNIKDEHAIIPGVLFPSNSRNMKFELEEGMSVLITGKVTLYEPQGKYQIIIKSIQPDGIGALYLAYEQTKEKLSKEGLFLPEHKETIPKYPKRIGVLTSKTGAVIQDIITTVKRRYPIIEIVIFPTVVQGNKSKDSIVSNLEQASLKKDLDVLIIARGGGSFEDLFSFNEEEVVRAISKVEIPIISSVGHETDTTLTDLVADLRAPTPTAAAELAVPVLTDEILKVNQYEQRLIQVLKNKIQYLSSKYSKTTNSIIFRQPERLYDGYLQNVDQLENQLFLNIEKSIRVNSDKLSMLEQGLNQQAIERRFDQFSIALEKLESKLIQEMNDYLKDRTYKFKQAIQGLDHLSPLKILGRGYSLIEKDEKLIHSAEEIQEDDKIQVKMHDGIIHAKANEIILKEQNND